MEIEVTGVLRLFREIDTPSRPREFSGGLRRAVTVLAAGTALFVLLYIGHVFEYAGMYLNQNSFRGIAVAFVLALIYLLYPATRSAPRDKLPWYDLLLLVVAIIMPLYYGIAYPSQLARWQMNTVTPVEIVMGAITLAVLFEATRRLTGLALPLLGTFLCFYVIFGQSFPGFLQHKGISLPFFMTSVGYTEGLFGFVTGIGLTIVLMFIIFGQFLLDSGGGEFFVKLANALIGKYRGGPAKMAVVASAFFAMFSGDTLANVATTGTVTIPLMKRTGYEPHFAGAVEAVASNGGQFTPPVMGAVAFVMAEFLQMPYWSIALAAAIPAFMYFVVIYIGVDVEAAKNGLVGLPQGERPSLKETLKEGWVYLLPLVVLVYLLGGLMLRPEISALYALLVLIIVTMLRKKTRMSPKRLVSALEHGVVMSLIAMVAIFAAGVVVQAFFLSGISGKLASGIVTVSGGQLFIALLLAAAASFVMGMGLATIVIYVVLSTFIAPALLSSGVPVLASHMFVFWWGLTSTITPPVAGNVFVACAISGAGVWKTGIAAMRLGMMAYVIPFVFVYQPALLLLSTSPMEVVRVVLITLGATAALSYGTGQWLLARLKLWESAVLVVGGVLLLMFNWISIGIGVAAILAIFLLQLLSVKRARMAAEQAITSTVPD
ncbi:MAG: TRAP transporter fused permease subunit [Chloroflexi bacterium]|nr:TRAP transporter fused permease subunit [Chloroflexota bacterium]